MKKENVKAILINAFGEACVEDNKFYINAEKKEAINYSVLAPYSKKNENRRYSNQGQIKHYQQLIKDTKNGEKSFLFYAFPEIDDAFFSVELFDVNENETHIELPDIESIKSSLFKSTERILRLKTEKIYFVAFKIGDENNRDYTALKDYIISSDNRTYNKVVRNLTRVEYVRKNNKDEKKENTLPFNMLVYGAPGTGKSHLLDDLVKEACKKFTPQMLNNEETTEREPTDLDKLKEFKRKFVKRITFYEDYSYENFVGCYKAKPESGESQLHIEYNNNPITGKISESKISYSYEPGPFIETYVKAKNDEKHDYYLFIEEINRAKAASVFGDIFQLLDRENGKSKYDITPEPALRAFLKKKITALSDANEEDITMSLPNNMYIWATMNSADQGVFTLDSAFKRRWEFRYKDIVSFERGKNICLIHDGKPQCINWDVFRTAINEVILNEGFDEDRCIGSYYFSDEELEKIEKYTKETDKENKRKMANPLVDKLLAYLRQDVFRMDTTPIFQGKKTNMSSIRQRVLNNENIVDILIINIHDLDCIDDSMKEWKELPEDDNVSDESSVNNANEDEYVEEKTNIDTAEEEDQSNEQ